MKIRNKKYVWPLSLATGLAVIGAIAAIVALTGSHNAIQAQDGASESDAALTLHMSAVEPGGTVWVRGTGFRVGTEASFIYTSTITIGDVPIAEVVKVNTGAFLHAGSTRESGLYIAEHIDIDPAGTTPDGEFVAQLKLPESVAHGDQELKVTSCWGGPDDAYPQDGVAPCGTEGLGGGVNDRVATATVTIIPEAPVLTVSPATAAPGDTIAVRGSGFRVGEEASFIYASTITIGGVPITEVASVDLASGYLHAGRTTDSGLYIAKHIDIDPPNTTPDGMFVAEFVLPDNLSPGERELKVTACWGGADGSYPEDGIRPCGKVGLGGGVNDREATATVTITALPEPEPEPELTVSPGTAEPGDTISVSGTGFRVGEEASFIYVSTITVGGMPILGVSSDDADSTYVHDARVTDGGTYIARHIDIDPAGTTPDGEFTADFVLPDDLPAGTQVLQVTSCYGGPIDAYPQDGADLCGTPGLGGGVNDRVAIANVTITEPTEGMLTASPSTAGAGDTITVSGTGFRVGTEASFIYVSTITIGGMPIASVASVDGASGYLHNARVTDGGTYIAQHIDIDPADTTADGAFTAEIVLPDDLPDGIHPLQVTSCWGGPIDAYPQDGADLCGTPGLGGGVNDRIALVHITIE